MHSEELLDFETTNHIKFRVHIQEFEDLGYGKDNEFYMDFNSIEEMDKYFSEFFSSNKFIKYIEEIKLYTKHNKCCYCDNFSCCHCKLKSDYREWNDEACECFKDKIAESWII